MLIPAVLFAQQAVQWEAQLEKQPDNIDLRSNLIREYFRLSSKDSGADKARVKHVLWVVAHRPEAPVMGEPAVTVGQTGEDYDAIANAWQIQVSKPDVTP
jgi:hypothetical protein